MIISNVHPAVTLLVSLVIIQIFITYFVTNGKKLSIAGLIRNVYAGLFFYLFYKHTKLNLVINVLFSLLLSHIAIFITSLIEVKLTTYPLIDDHVTTKYLYDDVLPDNIERVNSHSPPVSKEVVTLIKNYSEANFVPEDMGIDFDDTSPDNIDKIYKLGKQIFTTKHDGSIIYNINGKQISVDKLCSDAEFSKYDWFLSQIGEITPDTRILEVGFGNLVFMKYARSKNIKHIEGINISSVQCQEAEAEGFKTYNIDVNQMDKLNIGKYDLIVINGMMEYLITKSTKTFFNPEGSEEEIYTEFIKKLAKCLKPGGKYVNTVITGNKTYDYTPTLFTVWYGNNGVYPEEGAYIKACNNAGLTLTYKKDKTLHYYMLQMLRGTVLLNTFGQNNFLKYLFFSLAHPNIIASHICYHGLPDSIFSRDIVYNTFSWIYHFVPKLSEESGKYIYGTQLTKHRWFVFTMRQ